MRIIVHGSPRHADTLAVAEAISLKKETGYNPSDVQNQLAQLYLRLGRLSDVARLADEAYAEAQKTNAHEDFGQVFLLRAALGRWDGHLDSAQEMGEKAISELRVTKGVGLLPEAIASGSSILTARADLQSAEKLLETNASNHPEGQGAVGLARAELLLAKGQFPQAVDEAKRSAADFANAHLDENSAVALVLEADALEVLGRNPDALQVCREAERKAAQAPNRFPVLLARLALWRLSGDSDSSVPADLHASVVSLKNSDLSLQEDFDRAMRAKRTGSPNAHGLLHALADRAAKQGYLTLSRRARSLEQ